MEYIKGGKSKLRVVKLTEYSSLLKNMSNKSRIYGNLVSQAVLFFPKKKNRTIGLWRGKEEIDVGTSKKKKTIPLCSVKGSFLN